MSSLGHDGIVEDVKITNSYDQTGYNFETQIIHKKDQWNTTIGVDYIDIDINEKNRSISYNTFPAEFAEIPDFPFSTGVPILIDEFLTELDRNTDYRDAYLYATWNPNTTVSTTLAGSYVRYEDGLVDIDGFNPKIGITLSLPSSITIRAAYFESIVRPFILRQTIEPTHVNGFNQLFDDQDGSEIENYGLAFEKQFSPKLFSGIELISRNIDTFTVDTIAGTKFDAEQDETIFRSYLLWAPTARFSFGGEYFFELVDWDSDAEKLDIKTHQVPLQISYFHPNGAFFKLLPTYVKQEFELDRQGRKDDNFMITDIELGYRFANKHGEIRLGVKNLFNESFQYRDSLFRSTSLEISPYQPDRVGYLQISLTY
ncbi:MAG: TonB-dependent receptor [Candidatus Thiodiazotropha sp.]